MDLMTVCQGCGACCDTCRDWPRFTLESDEALAKIPEALIDDSLSRMRAIDDRCAALKGKVGEWTACTIYDVRPEVCRACVVGDHACQMAREKHGLPQLNEEGDPV